MKKLLSSCIRAAGAGAVSWVLAALLYSLHANRSITSMVLMLVVLGVASLGDGVLAVLTCVSASLAFSWYFVDPVRAFRITSWEGGFTYFTMLFTALVGSHLAIRAAGRATEAIRRREEMERLHRLGNVLLTAGGLEEAAREAVKQVVLLFGVSGATLYLDGFEEPFRAGHEAPGISTNIPIHDSLPYGALELHGKLPSIEVRSALANLISLVIDRARGAEERTRIEASQKGEELRNTVLNALAHNFKTPLTSIKAAASALRSSGELAGEAEHELAVVIDEEADRLELLIRESLNLARIKAHQQSLCIEMCSLAGIADTVRLRVARYLGAREFAIDIPDDLPSIPGDRFLFEQMLMQVVDNAWKYSKADAAIRLSAFQTGARVIVTVRNEGSSIPDEERSKIFTKFYRGADGPQVEGTGLGLPIAKAIAEAHGGTIWLESEPVGPAFHFSLPVIRDDGDNEQNDFAD